MCSGNEIMFGMDQESFDKLKPKITATYLDDLIVVTKLELTNACPKYSADIKVREKVIVLISKPISDDICDSNEIRKFVYIIKNPDKLKYRFVED